MRSASRPDVAQGFAPVFDRRARVLVLGSMPGVRSLDEARYYAHPRNAFWPIMGRLCGSGPELDYAARLERLKASGIALWDVIGRCRRPGSLDARIDPDSIEINDFAWLFERAPGVERVLFNGAMAERSYRRQVLPVLSERWAVIGQQRLPSTSPAHAAMAFEAKFERWKAALEPVLLSP